MNVFIIPSWYPSETYPSTGIFFKEQAELLARHRPDWKVGISLWGSHEPKLWIRPARPLEGLIRLSSRWPFRPSEQILDSGLVEFFSPAFTWSRKVREGNIRGIIRANQYNFERFTAHFGRPEIILAHTAHPGGYVAWHLSKKYKVPFVVVEHMVPFPMRAYRNDYKKYLIPPLQHADHVLAVSGYLVRTMAERGIKAEKTSNYIDDSFFVPGKSKNEIFTFVSIGRLENQKGYNHLLEAIKILKDRGVSVRVSIGGSGSLERKLKKQAGKLGLDPLVTWLGELSREEVRTELQNADSLALSSLHENQPVAILEALACGKPVVTTKTGAEEMINEACGVVVPPGDSKALAKGMEEQTKRIYSQERIRSYFESEFGTEKCIRELERVLLHIIGSSTLKSKVENGPRD